MRWSGWAIRTGLLVGGVAAAMGAAALVPANSPAAAPAQPAVAPQPKPVAKPPVPKPAVAAPAPAPAELVVKRILDIPGPIRFGEYYWDAKGIPADGALTITIDLEAETLSVFRDGYEIGATAILYGADEKPTPLGLHKITQKKVHHISNLYGAPMPYMMRLTDDGVAIHASEVEMGAATHGCIGVPLPFAKLLFAQAKLGDRVIITRGKRLGMGGVIAN
ncbi:L,D-transpeptidase family protein [Sphingomonas sp. BT-65]|uniref:L,D-transpeptidase family protein n=1 Tax=Sphingomonas sp. BT-65 TaxID=2989821 RepID=UPI002236BF1F|nr:L,D-transpeptidase family protein [Sphingomonas sp. BT-65]MCW4461976.1 L,D-transpeptidase family protein [Sphingomonas sp. BT-65]